MPESHEKRGRAQRKVLRRNEKEERKKSRREQDAAAPPPDVVDMSHFFPQEDAPPVRPAPRPSPGARSSAAKADEFGG